MRIGSLRVLGWTTLGSEGIGMNQFVLPHGIFLDESRRIYVANSGDHRIVRVDDVTGAGWKTLGTRGRGASQFSLPFGIVVDRSGRIFGMSRPRVSH